MDHAPDDPLDEASGFFYTEEGLRRASRHLAPDGVLGVWSYAESTPFSSALHQVFEEVRVEPVTFYVAMVEEERTDWLFFGRNGADSWRPCCALNAISRNLSRSAPEQTGS